MTVSTGTRVDIDLSLLTPTLVPKRGARILVASGFESANPRAPDVPGSEAEVSKHFPRNGIVFAFPKSANEPTQAPCTSTRKLHQTPIQSQQPKLNLNLYQRISPSPPPPKNPTPPKINACPPPTSPSPKPHFSSPALSSPHPLPLSRASRFHPRTGPQGILRAMLSRGNHQLCDATPCASLFPL